MAKLYVGTYAKYNSGSIAGAWLDLEDYADRDSFLVAARELHKDESDPELMYQDFEGFPRLRGLALAEEEPEAISAPLATMRHAANVPHVSYQLH